MTCRRCAGALAFVFQDFRLVPHLTALGKRRFAFTSGGRQRDANPFACHRAFSLGRPRRPRRCLSGRIVRRRTANALQSPRAVVNKPSLLLADEPTGNVDESAALKLLHLFIELNKMGTAILLATHQKSMVERIGQPALHLYKGKLISGFPEAHMTPTLPCNLFSPTFKRGKLGWLFTAIMAIMVYLATLAMALQTAISSTSLNWDQSQKGRMSVEIPAPRRWQCSRTRRTKQNWL